MFGLVAGAKQVTQVEQDSLENGARITPKVAFGIRTNLPNNISWIDENHVVYPVGGHMVSYDIETKDMMFFSRHLNVCGSRPIDALHRFSVSKSFISVTTMAPFHFAKSTNSNHLNCGDDIGLWGRTDTPNTGFLLPIAFLIPISDMIYPI
eukprot:TRINITY_DN1997_c0_g1_i2.p1 TRINITY_DN1997_c0_g1~~TRINITY_DN1997_c0_g1_i2.p1  ORF type:complete len:159 (+),score=29.92 TRINITY_DN1997_c0_g1_i2:27-479(+)